MQLFQFRIVMHKPNESEKLNDQEFTILFFFFFCKDGFTLMVVAVLDSTSMQAGKINAYLQ